MPVEIGFHGAAGGRHRVVLSHRPCRWRVAGRLRAVPGQPDGRRAEPPAVPVRPGGAGGGAADPCPYRPRGGCCRAWSRTASAGRCSRPRRHRRPPGLGPARQRRHPGRRGGAPQPPQRKARPDMVRPTYTRADAEAALEQVATVDYVPGSTWCPGSGRGGGMPGTFLGSASIELEIDEAGGRAAAHSVLR